MSYIRIIAVVAAAVAALPAQAKQVHVVQVDGVRVGVPVPAGYCVMDRNHPSDRRVIGYFERVNKGKNRILVTIADCRQLRDWRGGRRKLLGHYAYLTVATQLEGRTISMPPARFARVMERSFRRRGMEIVKRGNTVWRKRIEKTLPTVRVNENRFLGVLRTDGHAAYIGLIQRVRTEYGTEKVVLGMTSTGLVRGKVLSFSFYSDYAAAGSGPPTGTVEGLLDVNARFRQAMTEANRGGTRQKADRP
jgi:hypothetical protein